MIALTAAATYLTLIVWAIVKIDRLGCRGCRIERDETKRLADVRARRVRGRA